MIWQRLKNLWALSAASPEMVTPSIQRINRVIEMAEKSLQPATFIPRIKKTPLEQITEVANQSA